MHFKIILLPALISAAAAATITSTPPPTTTTTYAWDTYEDLYPNRVKNECSGDAECPVYHYCFYSYWAGA